MFSKTPTELSMKTYSNKIDEAARVFPVLKVLHRGKLSKLRMIETMGRNEPSSSEILAEDIPVCPSCGLLLIFNLHTYDNFV